MNNDTVLHLADLTKRFGGLTAVSDVRLDVQKNDIYGLIGPNGAGKTTIFNLITGILTPTGGDIRFGGESLVGLKPHVIANRGIARTFQNIKLFGNLSVRENVLTVTQAQTDYSLLEGFLRTPRCRREERRLTEFSRDIISRIGISQYEDTIAKNLSYGLQRRVEIARALALRPRLLLLDEPAAGMNEEESLALVQLIRTIQREFDLTIVVIDHHMDLIMNICNRITVLNFGQVICEGRPDEVCADSCVIEAYLGGDEN